MFDVTPEDIAKLDDGELRTLVGLLCEAELRARGISTSAVTYGGNQDSSDGGFDVVVSIDQGKGIDGYIPRVSTAFQVKATDLGPKRIGPEMCPAGRLRESITELAAAGGAYIIVSSKGSTSHTALLRRREAMRSALEGNENHAALIVDFYDRTRLASWVRSHPGLVVWVLERYHGQVSGWKPWGRWTGGTDTLPEYLRDDTSRLRFGPSAADSGISIDEGIGLLRDELRTPRSVVRLVGLSGVGKTRLAEALFDNLIGDRPLDPSLALYANVGSEPYPSPTSMAAELVTSGKKVILVVDNCTPELHQALMEVVTLPNSSISLLTIEYDIKDGQPEGTSVVSLEPASEEIVSTLVERRFPNISQVNAKAIAKSAGGNARVAIAIASTVHQSENITGLSDDQLFSRLFNQRRVADQTLTRAAEAMSLVYSFNGAAIEGEASELPTLARLAGQSIDDLYRSAAELENRDLIQKRGNWRAILPHAVANRLARAALKNIPASKVETVLFDGPSRLLESFSHRLSFLVGAEEAKCIARNWLAQDGRFGNVDSFDSTGAKIFGRIAAIEPQSSLEALQRSKFGPDCWAVHVDLIRKLAFDPSLFDGAAQLLVSVAIARKDRNGDEARSALKSLMQLYLSGTHASAIQRIAIVRSTLCRTGAEELGFELLDCFLAHTHFSSHHSFEFGGRSRDYGFIPKSASELVAWFRSGLELVDELCSNQETANKARELFARNFRGLWRNLAGSGIEVDVLARRLSAAEYWAGGWLAARQTLHFEKTSMPAPLQRRLEELVRDLGPNNLKERALALVISGRPGDMHDDEYSPENWTETHARLSREAEELGKAMARDAELPSLMPGLALGGRRVFEFGWGLAKGTADIEELWQSALSACNNASDKADFSLIRGLLAGLSDDRPDVAEEYFDRALVDRRTIDAFPYLQLAAPLNSKSIVRLREALNNRDIPTLSFANLAFASPEDISPSTFREMISLLLKRGDGFYVAVDVFGMRIFRAKERHTDLVAAGQSILRRVDFSNVRDAEDYHLAEIARYSLVGSGGDGTARAVVRKLNAAVRKYRTYYTRHDQFLAAMFSCQPNAVLDAFEKTGGVVDWQWFNDANDHSKNPVDSLQTETLTSWCDQIPSARYPFAASLVSLSSGSEKGNWSDHALAILQAAPDRRSVAIRLFGRFRPSAWSGPLSTILESRIGLLDQLALVGYQELRELIAVMRSDLTRAVEFERSHETARYKDRDERFE